MIPSSTQGIIFCASNLNYGGNHNPLLDEGFAFLLSLWIMKYFPLDALYIIFSISSLWVTSSSLDGLSLFFHDAIPGLDLCVHNISDTLLAMKNNDLLIVQVFGKL